MFIKPLQFRFPCILVILLLFLWLFAIALFLPSSLHYCFIFSSPKDFLLYFLFFFVLSDLHPLQFPFPYPSLPLFPFSFFLLPLIFLVHSISIFISIIFFHLSLASSPSHLPDNQIIHISSVSNHKKRHLHNRESKNQSQSLHRNNKITNTKQNKRHKNRKERPVDERSDEVNKAKYHKQITGSFSNNTPCYLPCEAHLPVEHRTHLGGKKSESLSGRQINCQKKEYIFLLSLLVPLV